MDGAIVCILKSATKGLFHLFFRVEENLAGATWKRISDVDIFTLITLNGCKIIERD